MSEKGTFPNIEAAPPKEPKPDNPPQDVVRKLGQIAIQGTPKK